MSDTTPDTGTTEAAPDAPVEQPAATLPDTGTDLAAEVEKWKVQARKHEDRAKANAGAAKELEKLRQDSMSDTEKAVSIARAEARAEALKEVGGELVDLAVRAAVADRGIDADALLDGLDRSRFVTDEGKADRDEIQRWVDRIAPKPTGVPDLGQGTRGTTSLATDDLTKAVESIVGLR